MWPIVAIPTFRGLFLSVGCGVQGQSGGQGGVAPLKLKTFYILFWVRNGSRKFASFCPNLNLKYIIYGMVWYGKCRFI